LSTTPEPRKTFLASDALGQARRFVIVGASNAAITYAIYLALLLYTTPLMAFAAAIGVAVVYTTVLNTTVVFRSGMTIEKFFATVLYQLVYSLANIGVFRLFLAAVPLPRWLIPAAVMCIMVPIHFICSKALAREGAFGPERKS